MGAGAYFCGALVHPSAGNFGQCIGNPLVNRFPVMGRRLTQKRMDFRARPQSKLAGIRLLRLRATLFAKCEIVVHAFMERLDQFLGTFSFERYDITNTEHTAMKDHVIIIELNRTGISFVKLHGFIPTLVRNWRISRIAQRLVSGDGCGRCRNKVWSPIVNLTREPFPSDFSASQAIRSASTSRHLIEPLTGFRKIAARVFSFVRFMAHAFISSTKACNLEQGSARGLVRSPFQ